MTGVKADKGKAPARFFYFVPATAHYGNDSDQRCMAFYMENFIRTLTRNETEEKRLAYLTLFTNRVANSLQKDLGISVAEVYQNISHVSEGGAKKYGIFNYQEGMKWSRLVDALGRHFVSFLAKDYIDAESGQDHRYHMLANILMLTYYVEFNVGDNDLLEEKTK